MKKPSPLRRDKRDRSQAYMAYVREHASCLQWESESEPIVYDMDVVAHHVRMGAGAGMGQKPSDFRTVPLTDAQHRDLHDHGERGFWARAGIDPEKVMAALIKGWLERGSGFPLPNPKVDESEYLRTLIRLAEDLNT